MKITKRQLLRIIREERQRLLREAPKEDKDLNTDELGSLKLPPILTKLLDPKISPAKYASLDQMIDASGNVNHQAFAIAAFTLSYADMDLAKAKAVLSKAAGILPKIVKAREAAKGKK